MRTGYTLERRGDVNKYWGDEVARAAEEGQDKNRPKRRCIDKNRICGQTESMYILREMPFKLKPGAQDLHSKDAFKTVAVNPLAKLIPKPLTEKYSICLATAKPKVLMPTSSKMTASTPKMGQVFRVSVSIAGYVSELRARRSSIYESANAVSRLRITRVPSQTWTVVEIDR